MLHQNAPQERCFFCKPSGHNTQKCSETKTIGDQKTLLKSNVGAIGPRTEVSRPEHAEQTFDAGSVKRQARTMCDTACGGRNARETNPASTVHVNLEATVTDWKRPQNDGFISKSDSLVLQRLPELRCECGSTAVVDAPTQHRLL